MQICNFSSILDRLIMVLRCTSPVFLVSKVCKLQSRWR